MPMPFGPCCKICLCVGDTSTEYDGESRIKFYSRMINVVIEERDKITLTYGETSYRGPGSCLLATHTSSRDYWWIARSAVKELSIFEIV